MNRIREFREARGITQAEVALRVGVQSTTVSLWERGLTVPRKRMAVKLARRLGVTVEELRLGATDEP